MTTPPLQWSIDVHALHASADYSFDANKEELEAIRLYAEIEEVAELQVAA